ncbi:MAG TPA: hypothetical protein VIJ47_04650 [Acidimicrobiales bacterium]
MAAWNAGEQTMNDLITQQVHVADWDALIATTIGPDGTSSMLGADQIHPTNPDGRIALAQLEWNAIRACAP